MSIKKFIRNLFDQLEVKRLSIGQNLFSASKFLMRELD